MRLPFLISCALFFLSLSRVYASSKVLIYNQKSGGSLPDDASAAGRLIRHLDASVGTASGISVSFYDGGTNSFSLTTGTYSVRAIASVDNNPVYHRLILYEPAGTPTDVFAGSGVSQLTPATLSTIVTVAADETRTFQLMHAVNYGYYFGIDPTYSGLDTPTYEIYATIEIDVLS